MDNLILKGKKGIVFGVANKMSIAWEIAKMCKKYGAEVALGYQDDALESRVAPLGEEIGCEFLLKCDVTDDKSIDDAFKTVKEHWGKFDFLVHSIAFANREDLQGQYFKVSRENFRKALDISCYSLTSLIQRSESIMNDNGSILTLSYYGAEKVMPSYNVMGVAKSALETSVKYLAYDLGSRHIRVNSISAGPVRTLASSAIGNFKTMLDTHAKSSPLKRNTTQSDVAGAAIYLLSDLSKGVTGQTHYVDSGYSIMGVTES